MLIYPSIDLLNGRCVRLYQGDYDQVTFYESNPLELAANYAKQGATCLHLVDLEGAQKGALVQTDLIINIAQRFGRLTQVGGGIRHEEHIQGLFDQGISRVVLGSIAILKPQKVKRWIEQFGSEKITLAVDVRINQAGIPLIAFHGWQETSELTLWTLLDEYSSTTSLRHVLCTDIACDGALQGTNTELYRQCVERYPALAFQASGGVSSLEDIRTLSEINVAGAIIGKALYSNAFSLSEVIEVGLC